MKFSEVFNNTSYLSIYNEIDGYINNFVIDTRKVSSGDCYIAIKGENNDGNLLFMDAFNNGASIVILDNFLINDEVMEYLKNNNKCIMLVSDTIKTLGDLARYKRSLFISPVVAITGSAGKTSTKDMIYSVLKQSKKAYKTIGNKNNHIGLPLTILGIDETYDVLVLEMGMNHLGEISYLTNIAKPNVAVITNVGTAHIGNLGNRENILKAKLEILEGLDKDGVLVINNDNDLLHKWYLENNTKYNIITIGIDNESDYQAKIIKTNEFGSSIMCNDTLINVPVGGKHFIYNALTSFAVGSYFNVDDEKLKEGILNFELSSNRMNIIESNNITIIDDSYNANFDSMSYAIKYLAKFSARKIACLGTMGELGDYSKSFHEKIGDLIYNEKIDILITVGEYTNYINSSAEDLGFNKDNSYHFSNIEDAIDLINKIKKEEDYILVKASNYMNFKKIVEDVIVNVIK